MFIVNLIFIGIFFYIFLINIHLIMYLSKSNLCRNQESIINYNNKLIDKITKELIMQAKKL
jgi:hypothetical protein